MGKTRPRPSRGLPGMDDTSIKNRQVPLPSPFLPERHGEYRPVPPSSGSSHPIDFGVLVGVGGVGICSVRST